MQDAYPVQVTDERRGRRALRETHSLIDQRISCADVERDGRMRNRERAETAVLGAAAAVALALVILYAWRPALLERLTLEDGVIEYLTAVLFLAAALVFGLAGLRGSSRGIWVLPLALACFAVAGEEISWGQRLLGLATPTGLESINVQGETNLHNIEGVHGNIRALAVLVLLG